MFDYVWILQTSHTHASWIPLYGTYYVGFHGWEMLGKKSKIYLLRWEYYNTNNWGKTCNLMATDYCMWWVPNDKGIRLGKTTFILMGVVVHQGSSIGHSHYTANVRTLTGWYELDDEQVSAYEIDFYPYITDRSPRPHLILWKTNKLTYCSM